MIGEHWPIMLTSAPAVPAAWDSPIRHSESTMATVVYAALLPPEDDPAASTGE